MAEVYVHTGDRGVLQPHSNKGRESTGAHNHGIFSLEVSEGTASFYPKFFLSPLTQALQRYSLPELPTTHSPLETTILPQSSETEACADPCLLQGPSCLGSATNLLPGVSETLKPISSHHLDE